jgi:hypothetical protein
MADFDIDSAGTWLPTSKTSTGGTASKDAGDPRIHWVVYRFSAYDTIACSADSPYKAAMHTTVNILAQTMPHAQIRILEGQDHFLPMPWHPSW